MRRLVIGFGNPLRRDDGVGPYVASRLERAGLPGVHVISCLQPMPELAEDLSRAERVVFVDAAVDVPPGEVQVSELGARVKEAPSLAHHFDAAALLSLTGQLYGRAPEAFLVGIGCESFALGEGLTPAAAGGAERAVQEILRLLTP